ncbi:hypothetical protein ACQ4PT_048371 [Festuca glaucescens]
MSKDTVLGKVLEATQSGVRVGYDPIREKSGVRKEYACGGGFIPPAPPGVQKKRSIFFTNPLFDPGSESAPVSTMASARGGGEQGGSGEDPTHPKPFSGRALLLEGNPVGSADRYVVEEISSSNWHPPAMEGLGGDEEDLLVGEVDMEDDAFVEEEPDEAPVPPPVPWRLIARYVGQISPSAETLKTHFTKVWMLRKGATFAPIKPKWFIITLNSEGDYNFVVNGGPWVHLGNAFLVQPLKGSERPSATDLTSLPIWVHMYDVPWDKQTEANGRKWGRSLGKVVEVDADKSKYRDFLRVRIEIPINKRLQTKLTTGVKDRPETHMTYVLRPAIAPAVQSVTKRGLDFSSSGDNSETLGMLKERPRRHVVQPTENVMPTAVDAHDDFERMEAVGDPDADRDLAVMLRALQVQCPMARSLWQAMEEVWSLPNVKELKSSDHEWLLHMLDGKTEVQRVMILMTLWRIWYCRNEVIHHKPAPSIECSRRFLCSYLESILMIKQFPDADPTKGKSVVVWERKPNASGRKMDMKEKTVKKWKKPPDGYVKLNVVGRIVRRMGQEVQGWSCAMMLAMSSSRHTVSGALAAIRWKQNSKHVEKEWRWS